MTDGVLIKKNVPQKTRKKYSLIITEELITISHAKNKPSRFID